MYDGSFLGIEMIYQKLAKTVLVPSLDFLRRTKVGGCLKELATSQWLTLEELREIQHRNLKFLIRHAYGNTPYYHRKFKEQGLKPDDIKTKEDLAKLPVLTREEFRNNFEDLIATSYPKQKMRLYATGGSTGEPLKFYVIKKQRSWETAAMIRGNSWCGYRLGDKISLIWGSPIDVSEAEKLNNKIINFFWRRLVLAATELSEQRMRRYAQRLIDFEPKIFRGYASAVYLFSKFVEHEGIDVGADAVITTAETLFDHQRRKIEEVFGCDVYDSYGSREVEEIASECGEHTGYHVAAENVVLEFVKNGECVSPGEMGSILVTNLRNYAMPFIRYEIGDIGKPSDEACSCGRGLPLMRSIEGRITDIIVTPKKFVPAILLAAVFRKLPIKQYQVIQETEKRIVVKIVKEKGYSQKDNNCVVAGLNQYLGDFQIDLQLVDSIPASESGKRRVVISKVPIEFAT